MNMKIFKTQILLGKHVRSIAFYPTTMLAFQDCTSTEHNKKLKNSSVFYTIFEGLLRRVYLPQFCHTYKTKTYNLVPNGVISFRRYMLPDNSRPNWSHSKSTLSHIHLTSREKIENINHVLQVNR